MKLEKGKCPKCNGEIFLCYVNIYKNKKIMLANQDKDAVIYCHNCDSSTLFNGIKFNEIEN